MEIRPETYLVTKLLKCLLLDYLKLNWESKKTEIVL